MPDCTCSFHAVNHSLTSALASTDSRLPTLAWNIRQAIQSVRMVPVRTGQLWKPTKVAKLCLMSGVLSNKLIEVGVGLTLDVRIVPSRKWSEKGTSGNAQPSLLGLTLRLCNPTVSITHVWHILDVLEGSPADSAGLVPFGDYIIGWTGGPLESESDFFQLIEHHAGRNLAVYVYNRDYDHTREVIIMPNRDWGGEGLLGCGVGYGLLRMYTQLTQTASPSLNGHGNKTMTCSHPVKTQQCHRFPKSTTRQHSAHMPRHVRTNTQITTRRKTHLV